jgi:hypothetical protein
MSKSFTDTLQGVVGNRKDLNQWIFDEGIVMKKPFIFFPEKKENIKIKSKVKTK